MSTTSDAILMAIGFLGFGASRFETDRQACAIEPAPAVDADRPSSPDLLSQGEPYFEAVAAALRRTGYLEA